MCDCYSHQCKECDVYIPMHLSDFLTGRDEIEVFCKKHIPENVKDGIVWKCFKEDGVDLFDEYEGEIFVRPLTENARQNCSGNMYNGSCEPIKIFGKKATKKQKKELCF